MRRINIQVCSKNAPLAGSSPLAASRAWMVEHGPRAIEHHPVWSAKLTEEEFRRSLYRIS